MAFVIVKCIGLDGFVEKSMINLDKVQNILELTLAKSTVVDFGKETINIQDTIEEICANAFSFEPE